MTDLRGNHLTIITKSTEHQNSLSTMATTNVERQSPTSSNTDDKMELIFTEILSQNSVPIDAKFDNHLNTK